MEVTNGDLNKFVLLLRKGVYPYEYMDSWERFNETSLPDKKASQQYIKYIIYINHIYHIYIYIYHKMLSFYGTTPLVWCLGPLSSTFVKLSWKVSIV